MIGAPLALAAAPAAAAPKRDWAALGRQVKADMAWAWGHYAERALGQDQIKPVSGTYELFFFAKGRGLGLTAVEALDTLYLMGLDAELGQAVRWICDNLDFDIDGEVQVFETSIRMVGGLLSGHLATGDKRLLALAKDLADRLMPAFRSRTGLPYRFVNLRTGAVRDKVTFPAEFGTYVAEFALLSKLTGDWRPFQTAKKAMRAGFDRRSSIGLVADAIDVETGAWLSRRASIGPPTDSYFESLWDGWHMLGDHELKRWHDVHAAAILEHQSDRVDGRLWFAQVDFETGRRLDRRQSELAAFYAGLLGQSGRMDHARDYLASWTAVQARYGVLPEGFDYGRFEATRKTNDLRPEYVDSCLNLWLIDRDERWRELAAIHYEAMRSTSRARFGFTVLADVTTKRQGDACPGYWWSEQMKYYWLMFADCPRFDYRDNLLSTEGNVLRGLK
jgi:mannosyl-oligosaccharide alpha-1,2-mannosidase